MNAELLREAASLMRERAEADGSRGWQVEDANEGTLYNPLWMVTNDAFHNPPADEDGPWLAVEIHTGTRATAEHIASWHPAVALAVADWLDNAATLDAIGVNHKHHALAVARAYLGRERHTWTAPRLMTDHCLIGCITSDDEGRGYYCEECPELRRAHRAPLREGPVPEHQVGSIADLHAADDSALIGPDGFTRLSGEPERIAARAVELATERDAALARIARAERLIDSWERDAPDHSNPVFIGRLREALRRDPVPVRLRGVPTETPSEERCVVCSRSAPRHGGLCCFHKYDEQPTCDVCAADEDPS